MGQIENIASSEVLFPLQVPVLGGRSGVSDVHVTIGCLAVRLAGITTRTDGMLFTSRFQFLQIVPRGGSLYHI